MTVPSSVAHVEYIGDGSTTVFSYVFQIAASSEMEVRVDGVVKTETVEYSISGVGSPTGGSVTFFTAPASGTVVSLRRVVAVEQLLDLQPNVALPAESVEGRLDKIVEMVAMLIEELSRRPALTVGVSSTYRDLDFPAAVANKLIGWNATATALTTFDSSIITVTPDPTAGGVAFGKNAVTVSPTGGESVLTASGAIPSGSMVLGVTVNVTTGLGNTNGLSGFDVGGMGLVDGWGTNIAIAASTTTGVGNFNRADHPIAASAEDVTLTARGGTFDATGAVKITVHYITLTPDS